MKELLKKLAPEKVVTQAQKYYWSLTAKTTPPKFSDKDLDALTALKCIVSYNRYGGYCVPLASRHRPAARKILANEVYEPKTIEFMTSHCQQGDIVHAGTYFGDFLPALSKACAPDAKVWAFEPNPENFRCASITTLINDLQNVTITNAGLGARPETLLMKTRDEEGRALGGASQILDAGTSSPAAQTESVEIVTIDDSIGNDRSVSIIQLDVEGHEKEALTGAMKTIQRCLPIIILEVLPNSTLITSDWFKDNILRLGYQNTNNIQGNSVFIHQH